MLPQPAKTEQAMARAAEVRWRALRIMFVAPVDPAGIFIA
jgi:hypothetical protein